jgi:hypothetical protein
MKIAKRGMLIALVSAFGAMPDPTIAEPGLMVVTSDYQTGSIAYLPPDSQTPQVNLLAIHPDAGIRYRDGRVYVINRLGQDNILVLDPGNLAVMPALQFSVGNGTNPQDIEFASPAKAYVTRYESTRVLVVDPRDGRELGEIDLAAFADTDGLPEMGEMAIVGQRLYVACQRLDRNTTWGPADDSYLAVVDTRTDELVDTDQATPGVQGIKLAGANPNTLIAVGRQIVVAGSGAFGDRAGGIEVIDTDTSASSGLLVTEDELGGDITGLAMVSAIRGYAVVTDENYVNRIRPVDLDRGTVGPALAGHSGGYTPDLAVDGTRLIVADTGTFSEPNAAGLLFYDAGTGTKLTGPVSVGLPPSGIAILAEVEIPTAVLESDGRSIPARASLGCVYPNPFNAGVQIPFAVGRGASWASLAIYDVLGRRIRVLAEGHLTPGSYTVSWDTSDQTGVSVGSGTYFVELRSGEGREVRKLTLLK